MPDIEVAVSIFRSGVISVLRQPGTITEIPIRAYVIQECEYV
jgi:hypothetical protein